MSNSLIKWDEVRGRDNSSANSLLLKSNDMFQDSLKGLSDTLKGVQTEVRNRNNAAALDYINRAANPEELQSDTYRQGYQNLLNSFANEYNPLEMSKAYDSRIDTLKARAVQDQQMMANDQNYELGKLNLTGKEQENASNLYKFNSKKAEDVIYAEKDPIKRKALIEQYASEGIQPGAQTSLEFDKFGEEQKNNESTRAYTAAQIKQAAAQSALINANTKGKELENQTIGLQVDTLYNVNGVKDRSPNFNVNAQNFNKSLPRVAQYDDLITRIASEEGVDPNMIRAMMMAESTGNNRDAQGNLIRSPKGAQGLMQLMPATAQRFGVKDVSDPAQNIRGGAKYIRWLTDRYKGDTNKILAGYNAGEGNVDKYGGVPPFKETKGYVQKIGDYLNILRTGNDGSKFIVPDGMTVNGSSIGSGSNKSLSQAEQDKAYGVSPDGIKAAYLKQYNDTATKGYATAKDQGVGSYKSVTELESKMRSKWRNDSSITDIIRATTGGNVKFNDPSLKAKYDPGGVKDLDKLSEAQKAWVIESTLNEVKRDNITPLRNFYTTDEDMIKWQGIAQKYTDQLTASSKATYQKGLDATDNEAVNNLVSRYNYSPEEAKNFLGINSRDGKKQQEAQAQKQAEDKIRNAKQAQKNQLSVDVARLDKEYVSTVKQYDEAKKKAWKTSDYAKEQEARNKASTALQQAKQRLQKLG